MATPWLKNIERTLLGFLALCPIACSYDIQKNAPLIASSDISYATVKQAVFVPRCVMCHDGSPGKWGAGTFADVKERIEKINQRVLERKDMPPGSPLSPSQMELLSTWIAAGAPEQGKAPVVIPDTPLEPKYASINEKIFIPLCSKCHLPGGSAAQVPLTRNELLNSPRLLVVPFKADESGLFIAVRRKDKKRMPPPDSGIRKLTPEEIAVIVEWINAGAKD